MSLVHILLTDVSPKSKNNDILHEQTWFIEWAEGTPSTLLLKTETKTGGTPQLVQWTNNIEDYFYQAKYISFNFNRNEGKLNNNDFKKEKYIFSNSLDEMDNKTLNKEKKRKNLIFYFIILGIISFLFETLLLKFWKN